ncbi:DUF4238 domain-containing protein [Oceanobacillus sp. CAU 1775]
MKKDKIDYVKQQHFMPQFVLENFRTENNQILFINTSNNPLVVCKSNPKKLMRENDFYEVKDAKGNYVLRNSIEDIYSAWESDIKPNYQAFIDLSRKDNFQDEFVKIIQNGRWYDIETSLLKYLIKTLIRGKAVKNLMYSNENLNDSEKHIMYLLATTSQVYTIEFAKKMYAGQDLKNILLFIKSSTEEPLKVFIEHILHGYQIRVHKASGNKKFFLSDNPVIVQKFEGEDYHLPISSEICIGLTPIKIDGDTLLTDNTIYHISDKNIERINEQSVLNTDKLLIISNEEDLEFVSNIQSRNNS